jgi:hypothetical protein
MSDKTVKLTHQPFDVFISYASDDKSFARRLVGELQERGLTTWFDEKDLKPGEDWSMQIRQGIDNARSCIVLLSQASATSKPWISKEWAAIQECSWRRPDFRICPIEIDDVETPVFLRTWKALKCDRRSCDFDATAEKIVAVLSYKKPAKESAVPDSQVLKRFDEIRHWLQRATERNEESTDE